jgi:DNA-directed RNA polymerase specialized sigma24 family protein
VTADIPDPTGEHPTTWAGLLAAYRLDPSAAWSGLLLERLGPWLGAARRQLIAVPPYLDSEDVSQELALEVLRIAAQWRPSCEDHWIPRRLVERAARKVCARLLKERFSATEELKLDLPSGVPGEPELLFETPVGKATAKDMRVLHRVLVLGEPIETLAAESGISTAEMRRAVALAKKRARAGRPEGTAIGG